MDVGVDEAGHDESPLGRETVPRRRPGEIAERGDAPFAHAAGLSPLIMGLVALKAGNLFLLPQQSPYYLTLYYGTEERAFGHRDARPFAWVYAGAVLAGFLLSLPYWRALGLVAG
jgi:hypothetical protein